MGKDSLLKSTVKKASGKPAAARNQKTPKKASTAKKIAQKAPPAKKASFAKTEMAPKSKTGGRPKTPGGQNSKMKKPGKQKLILKKFGPWQPEKIFRVEPPPVPDREAPPFLSGKDDSDRRRLKTLLFKKFDSPSISTVIRKPAPIDWEPGSLQTNGRKEDSFTPAASEPRQSKFDPATRMMIYFAAGFVVLLALIIAASISNRSNYYLKVSNGTVEVWQGTFAPLGQERILTLPGGKAPVKIKPVYLKDEIYAFVFKYYLSKADKMLEVSGIPDFEKIKASLNLAQAYALAAKEKAAATTRLNSLELMTNLYKADVAASTGMTSGYQDALGHLERAAALRLNDHQAELVKKKIQDIKQLMAAQQPGTATPSAEKTKKTPVPR